MLNANWPDERKGENMQTTDSVDKKLWKRCLQDALVELEPQVFWKKMEAADQAIEMRRLELNSTAKPDSLELAELRDGLNTLRALGFLKGSNGAMPNR
jgi:hypothetical protein